MAFHVIKVKRAVFLSGGVVLGIALSYLLPLAPLHAVATDRQDMLAMATGETDLAHPLVVRPAPNTIASFAGDRVHWVQPLYAGERLSVVINFY